MKRTKGMFSAALAAVLCIALLAGCGGGGASGAPSGGGSKAVHVKTTEEFLNAIKPDAEIVLEKGFYNMSDYIEKFYHSSDYEKWAADHPYAEIREEYDGCEIVINDVSNLKISGAGECSDTELVVEPRYASVLYFENCTNVEIDNLTMGHTESGECAGNVLDFDACRKITVDGCDLYGCGVYGIGANSGSGDIHVLNSTIRDCSYGPFEFYNIYGDIEFRNCSLTGSGGSGSYWDEYNNSNLAFYSCNFGYWESDIQYYGEDAVFEDCEFEEEYNEEYYGDYDVDVPDLDVSYIDTYLLESVNSISSTSWTGYMYMEKGSKNYNYLAGGSYDGGSEYATLIFNDDYTADIEINGSNDEWGYDVNADGTVSLQKGNDRIEAVLYTDAQVDYVWYWLALELGDRTIWFY